MRRRFATVLFGLSISGVAAPLKPPVGVTTTQRFDFHPGGFIRVEHSFGYLKVEGWDRSEVEVILTKTMPFDYKVKHPEQARGHLEAISITATRKSDMELDIATAGLSRRYHSTGGVKGDFKIHVPRDSRLAIRHDHGGFVMVSGLTGDIEASSRHGDIVLMLPDSGVYSIDAKCRFGIVASDFLGDTHRRLLIGERLETPTANPSHRVYVRVGYGGITIVAVPPDSVEAAQHTPAGFSPH